MRLATSSRTEIAGYSYFGAGAARALLDHVRANPCGGSGGGAVGADYVILISVDGLASWLLEDMVDGGGLPNFRRLQEEGAWTHNARTDFSHTNTIPNHTSMITGRPVTAVPGMPADTHHGYTVNIDSSPADTLHNSGNPALAYVPSAFDVAHDHGLRTCLFASKTKFVIFEQSYDADGGAPDTTGGDDGRDKIDVLRIEADTPTMTADFVTAMQANPCNFTFLHFRDPDSAGHATGWGSPEWVQAVQNVDVLVGRVLALVDNDPRLQGKTTILLTADHGGSGTGHSGATDPKSHTIPFYVRGPGIPAGVDLHQLTSGARQDPGTDRTSYASVVQPVRNGDSGNLALGLLGLEQIPGSLIRDMGIAR